MTHTRRSTESVDNLIRRILDIFDQMEAVPQLYDAGCASYKNTCLTISEQIRAGRMKLAVVGVIKSGKSTFVNALVGKDLVKRGAGAMTSITTRIQKGKKNKATIYFKSWDQINSQLESALKLFPDEDIGETGPRPFDIRRKNDRDFLARAYQTMCTMTPVSKGRLRPEPLMVRHAIDGYERCRHLVQADETSICFTGKAFEKHKEFTSDADAAFFVKDVCLDVFGKKIDPDLEVADCQGADSTDPAGLEQVLDYLDAAHLIIYCISSRNGLRQSDIHFLNRIKKMGLIDRVLFLNNCDLTEHESLADLQSIEAGIKKELEFLQISPELHTFSCLYTLFQQTPGRLPKKDAARLKTWQEEPEMIRYCSDQMERFFNRYHDIIDRSRNDFLLAGHLNRLGMILSGLAAHAQLFGKLFSPDHTAHDAFRRRLTVLHQNASRLESIVANSIDGAVSGLETEVWENLDRAFSKDGMTLLADTRNFIETMPVDIDTYRKLPGNTGFNQILYLMFQDFKRALDLFIIENVKPKVRQFVKTQEQKIATYFQSLLNSYQIDLMKTGDSNELGAVEPGQSADVSVESVDIVKIKDILGLEIPAAVFWPEYTTETKLGVLADFSLQTAAHLFSAVLGKKQSFSFSPGLEKAGYRMRRRTARKLGGQLSRYQNRLEQDYFTPLIAAGAREFRQIIRKRFSHYALFKRETEQALDLKAAQRQTQFTRVEKIRRQIQKAETFLGALQEDAGRAG